ncbi:SDR family NAD(P)-dependent oxidoreductase [Patulibacter sp.]|uniref:SDR family NAD(P)-dependent oxidoreductase n=1 Tax=Patulibacter sp. TaxID=1912859 RepID=UPI00271E7301|nr:SDR family NAD(P)-dependent oxidoreductase [Patulibacter sp.]MDO9409063.1 SDR family NAD(P)-dependent oxidoreductase [Patulibacter sp.]
MSRIFVTGSADGLGRSAADALLQERHDVVVHVRSPGRADAVADLVDRGASVVVGDLADPEATRDVADQVNGLGRMDAVIHNAGVHTGPAILRVNVVAPYVLTALIDRPDRLVYLSSNDHFGGRAAVLRDVDWGDPAGRYADSKLLVTALSAALARRWSDTTVSAVDPGWVPTRMGGAGAPDDLVEGHRTQTWLAVADDAEARTSGGYWFHRERQDPHEAVTDERFQDELVESLERHTGLALD